MYMYIIHVYMHVDIICEIIMTSILCTLLANNEHHYNYVPIITTRYKYAVHPDIPWTKVLEIKRDT